MRRQNFIAGEVLRGPLIAGRHSVAIVLRLDSGGCLAMVADLTTRRRFVATQAQVRSYGWYHACLAPQGWTLECRTRGETRPNWRAVLPDFESAASLVTRKGWEGPEVDYAYALESSPNAAPGYELAFFDDAGCSRIHS